MEGYVVVKNPIASCHSFATARESGGLKLVRWVFEPASIWDLFWKGVHVCTNSQFTSSPLWRPPGTALAKPWCRTTLESKAVAQALNPRIPSTIVLHVLLRILDYKDYNTSSTMRLNGLGRLQTIESGEMKYRGRPSIQHSRSFRSPTKGW